MQKLILFLFLFFSSVLTFANSDKAIQYHKLIAEAHQYQSISDYSNSLHAYQNAFSVFEKPLAKDLYEAMLFAAASMDKFHFFFYAELLSKHYGVPVDFYTKNQILQVWKDDSKWRVFLSNVEQNHAAFIITNSIIIQQIDSLHVIVKKYNSHLFDKTYSEETLNNKIKEIRNILLQLFNQYGFITEAHIGLNLINDTIPVDSKILEIMRFSMLSIHDGNVEETIVLDYDPHIKKAFEEGKISLDEFYRLYSFK